jgi:hypothetical protein
MSGPLRKIISVVDKEFSPGTADQSILSIELQPDGFSFLITDNIHKRCLLLQVFKCDDENLYSETAIELLKSEFRENPFLHSSYQKIIIACHARHLLLFPVEISTQDDLTSLYRLACKLPENHLVKTDHLINLGGLGVYAVHKDLCDLLDDCFPDHHLVHSSSILIENLLVTNFTERNQPELILHVRQTYFEIILIQESKLIFFKQFSYSSIEDLFYYLFYVLQQFKLDALKMDVLLTGEINLDWKAHPQMVLYFNNVRYLGRNDKFQCSTEFDNIPHHYFNNLLNLIPCE